MKKFNSLSFILIVAFIIISYNPIKASASFHPADINNDWHIDFPNDDVNKYFLCWKTGCNWALTNPSNPGPGPTDPSFIQYMNSAAVIWKSGESYHYDSTQACPQCYVAGPAQAASTWAESFGGEGNDSGIAVTVDGIGNVYVVGLFYGTATFAGTTLTSSGGAGMFLAKYNSAGVQQWVQGYSGTSGGINATGIGLDSSGNIFVAGYYTGTANFGGQSFTSAGQQDAFVAKYSSQGQHIWSESFGGIGGDYFNGLSVDSAGNVVVIGSFQGNSVSFGGSTSLSSAYGTQENVVLAKYSSTGTNMWAETFFSSANDYGNGIAIDKRVNPQTGVSYDSIFVTGQFYNNINFGLGKILTASPNAPNIFVAKFAASGSNIWSYQSSGINGENATAVTVDGNGDAIVGGIFAHQTNLGGGTITGTGISDDMFLAKYSGLNGSFVWASDLTGDSYGWVNSISTDDQNNIVLTGWYYGTLHLGGQSMTCVLASDDVFVAKYTAGGIGIPGSFVWGSSFGGPSTDEGNSVVIDPTGHPIITGAFGGTAVFGSTTLISAGSYDAFLMKMTP